GGDHHQHDPGDHQCQQQQEADDDHRQDQADQCGNGHVDLEVERFLALIVDEGILVLLDQPEHQHADQVAEREEEPGQTGKVTEHRPLAGGGARAAWQLLLSLVHALPPNAWGQLARACRCASNSSRMPFCASASMALSCSGSKGSPSAVPCTSMKPPASVITTLRSVSAAESSG